MRSKRPWASYVKIKRIERRNGRVTYEAHFTLQGQLNPKGIAALPTTSTTTLEEMEGEIDKLWAETIEEREAAKGERIKSVTLA